MSRCWMEPSVRASKHRRRVGWREWWRRLFRRRREPGRWPL